MRMLQNRVPPPVLVAVIGMLMWLARQPSASVPASAAAGVAGAVLILGGAAICVAGVREFRRAGTTVNPVDIERAEKLVTSGVFGISRNPMYVGFATVLLGWAVTIGGWLAYAGPVLLLLWLHVLQVAPEERVMRMKFGAAYDEYTSRVRRWL